MQVRRRKIVLRIHTKRVCTSLYSIPISFFRHVQEQFSIRVAQLRTTLSLGDAGQYWETFLASAGFSFPLFLSVRAQQVQSRSICPTREHRTRAAQACLTYDSLFAQFCVLYQTQGHPRNWIMKTGHATPNKTRRVGELRHHVSVLAWLIFKQPVENFYTGLESVQFMSRRQTSELFLSNNSERSQGAFRMDFIG